MSAPSTSLDAPECAPLRSSESITDAVSAPLLLHTPGPIPPIDDEDDEDDDRRGGGPGGGNIDPDDDEDVDDDEDDDDDADKQWAGSSSLSRDGAASRFVL